MTAATVMSLADMMRDHYPQPGQRIKQYVIDMRREADWERDTAPSVYVRDHDDNTLMPCRNAGNVRYHFLDHDACDVCGALHEAFAREPRIRVWLDEKAKRPPICADRSKLSEEVEPRRDDAVNTLVTDRLRAFAVFFGSNGRSQRGGER